MDAPHKLSHEQLDVYQTSIRMLELAHAITKKLPRGHSQMGDQLRRAALSIPLNIAEGYGKWKHADQSRFYDIARGSAHECGAILDSAHVLELIDSSTHAKGKEQLHRIISMLVKMVI